MAAVLVACSLIVLVVLYAVNRGDEPVVTTSVPPATTSSPPATTGQSQPEPEAEPKAGPKSEPKAK